MNCLSQRKKFKNKHPVWSDEPEKPAEDDTPESKDAEVEPDPASDADGSDSSSSDGDDDVDMYAKDVRSKKISLENQTLLYKHLTSINCERAPKGGVQCVQFNPTSKIALVANRYGQLDLFEVDGERNRYIQNVKLPKTNEPFCSFTPEGNAIIMSSEIYKGTFFNYDMLSGSIRSYDLRAGRDKRSFTDFIMLGDYMACRKAGSPEVMVLSSKTYENIASFKINRSAKSIQFLSENELLIMDENAGVYLWDLRKSSSCKHRFQDHGSVNTHSLAATSNSKLIAIGSDMGIVNLYDAESCMEKRYPTPLKTFRNLKSSVEVLKFNKPGELLLMGSKADQGDFRLVHSHSCTVYRNFPIQNRKYGALLSADFSPNGGYLALGASSGRAHLCRLSYYKSY